jgi:hypothetical protein
MKPLKGFKLPTVKGTIGLADDRVENFRRSGSVRSGQTRSRSPQGLGRLKSFQSVYCPFPPWLRESALRANVNDYWVPLGASWRMKMITSGSIAELL